MLNRNSRPQSEGVHLIEADRHALGNRLKGLSFDAVIDVTAYTARDVSDLLDGLGSFGDYVLISSSAVYPETLPQPFSEEMPVGANAFWGRYGTDKIAAEQTLRSRVPHAYILRPPYLYGPMNNVYREAFVFDCAMRDRPFFLPKDGSMPLQFFHPVDLCRCIERILTLHPEERLFNVGNEASISIRDWVSLCYRIVGKTPRFLSVPEGVSQRDYFSFYDYAYALDVSRQKRLLPSTLPLEEGLRSAWDWYRAHPNEVHKKPFMAYIDEHFLPGSTALFKGRDE